MSPIVWDLGHIATFEDLWLAHSRLRHAAAARAGSATCTTRTPRRAASAAACRTCAARTRSRYLDEVRERVLDLLDGADLRPARRRCCADGFVYEMVLRHEQQHTETILQTLQLMTSTLRAAPARGRCPRPSPVARDMALVPGGPFEMGAGAATASPTTTSAPRHEVDVAAFRIDRVAGHQRRVHRVHRGRRLRAARAAGRAEGWAWRAEEARAPAYWRRDGDGWPCARSPNGRGRPGAARLPRLVVRGRRVRALGRQAPADRGRVGEGRRWDDAGERLPWGDAPPTERANLDQLAFGCAPAGAYAAGESAFGMRQTLGDVWEWTASGFEAYPGSRRSPTREYSQDFFGGPFKVLRGGSWATQAGRGDQHLPQLGLPAPPPDLRRLPLRRGRGGLTRERRHRRPPNPCGSTCTCATGRWPRSRTTFAAAFALPARASAEVLLRRARVGAVRADHRAAGVLPVAGRAGHPRRGRARDRRARAARRRSWSSAPARRARRPPCWTRCWSSATAAAATSRSTSPRPRSRIAPSASSRGTSRSRCTASSATSSATSTGSRERSGRRLIAFLGGTIGNLDHPRRSALLKALRAQLGPEDRLLVGTDLVKDRERLEAAYNDSAG